MLTHIVIFKWIDDAKPAQIETLRQGLDQLAADMSETALIRHGPDLHFRENNGDYALVARFADRAAWDAYQADPRHKALVRDLVSPIQASRLTIQF